MRLFLPSAMLALLVACAPPCERTCRKVLDCSLDSQRVAQEECVDMCERQTALYEQWEDDNKIEAFKDHRRCLVKSTCGEIADGVCYDETLFIYSETEE